MPTMNNSFSVPPCSRDKQFPEKPPPFPALQIDPLLLKNPTAEIENPPKIPESIPETDLEQKKEGLSLLFAASLLQKENPTHTTPQLSTPQPQDVVCGRGGGTHQHLGNRIYRRIVDYNKETYRHVPKRHRQLVSQSIVQVILNHGGRFLQRNDNKWTEISFRRAVQKTSQALRERVEDVGSVSCHRDAEEEASLSSTQSDGEKAKEIEQKVDDDS